MRKYIILFIALILLFLTGQIDAQTQIKTKKRIETYRNSRGTKVPLVSAYEAYVKFKAGKAFIIHSGGMSYERRHIMGAFNAVGSELVRKGKVKLPKYPKKGVGIFTYCY